MALGLLLLGGCPTVDLGDTPSDIGVCNPAGGIEYFEAMIWPEYIKPMDGTRGCSKTSCHGEGGTSPNFRTMPVDFVVNYRVAQNFLNCGQPMMSDLLTKPMAGINAHGGGELFPPSDASVQIFLDWFTE
jgi:hypothetical protein